MFRLGNSALSHLFLSLLKTPVKAEMSRIFPGYEKIFRKLTDIGALIAKNKTFLQDETRQGYLRSY